jgi:hypothetical protein
MYQTFSMMPQELKGRLFLGFSPQTPPAEAAAAFERRHGRAPAVVVAARNNLLVGPLPQPEPRQLALSEVA